MTNYESMKKKVGAAVSDSATYLSDVVKSANMDKVKKVAWGLTKDVGVKFGELAAYFLAGAIGCPLACHGIATANRIVPEIEKEYKKTHGRPRPSNTDYPTAEEIMIAMGISAGAFGTLASYLHYLHPATHRHPEILAVPVMTNIASVIYEKIRAEGGLKNI